MTVSVPAETAIRRSRVGNIDTDRLTRRRDWLILLITERSHTLNQRIDFVARVAELAAIEREMLARGVLSHPHLDL